VGDGNTFSVDQKAYFYLAAVRPMIPTVAPFCYVAAVSLELAGGEIIKYQREVQIENIVDIPEDIFLQ